MHRFARVFLMLAVGCLVAAWLAPLRWVGVLWVWVGVSFGAVSYAYLRRSPGVFLKDPGGNLPPLVGLLFGPYLLLYNLFLCVFRMDRRHAPYAEIEPGVYLGCRLHALDEARVRPHEIAAVLDLTAELPGILFWRTGEHYHNLPTLDATSPTPEQLGDAAHWIAEQRAAGRNVYIHCAFGHGRSATAVAAYLLYAARVRTPEEAFTLMKAKRPGVKFSAEQWAALREFACGIRE